jgi:hypothetical protein
MKWRKRWLLVDGNGRAGGLSGRRRSSGEAGTITSRQKIPEAMRVGFGLGPRIRGRGGF